jgi:thioesterase domain-containing protein/acyl carrier protein
MNLVKTGEEGELYIGGDSLSNGYLHKKIPNEKKFIVNQIDSDTKSKLYKTGDIVKWLESGDLLYVGRNNDQIKINGVRIEPNELVSHILKNPQVSNCIVTKKHDSSNHSFLACYIVPKKSNELDINNIKNALKDFFPRYMLPKTYTILKSIPLTINGKIDILALPEPLIEPRTQGSLEKNISNEERKLLTIWKNLMKYDNIHIEDNFFEIGGNSILAFQLLVNIKSTFRLSIHIKDIFLYPSIREQAALIHRLKKKKVKVKDINLNHSFQNSVIPLQRKGGGTPLFLIHPIGGTVFWYSTLAQLLGNSRPIYAIQDPAIECGKNIFSSIEEMADAYIALIQKIQPLGPYLIGGASFGATVAVEIANRLKKLNQETVFVTILDGWAVYPNTLLNDAYFKVSMERQHAVLKMEFEKYNLPDPRDLFSIQWHRLSLLWKYQLTEISCPIILFKAEEILPAFQEVDALLNHWEIYTKQPICSFVVPGNHETMFQMPQVRKLADALKKCLRKIKI